MTHEAIVLLSPNDGDLLIKAHDILVEAGFKSDKEWNADCNPKVRIKWAKNKGRKVWNFALRIYADKIIAYHNHECNPSYQINLTHDNLNESVQFVIDNFKS